MRLIIEEAQSRSLREGDFYDEIGITPALNLAQRLASDALTVSNQTALDLRNERAPNVISVTLTQQTKKTPCTSALRDVPRNVLLCSFCPWALATATWTKNKVKRNREATSTR